MSTSHRQLLASICLAGALTLKAATLEEINQYKDLKSAGWAFKDDDQAFEIRRANGCTIKWNVITDHARPKELLIAVKDTCRFDDGLAGFLPYYGRILDAILAKYPMDRLKIFQSTSWREIKDWDRDLAVAAIESDRWNAFLKNRKSQKDLLPNDVFVEVFNQSKIARKLNDVFKTRGLTLRLKSVEKVMEARFSKLPFAYQYAAYSASPTPVPVSAGSYEFEIMPLGKPGASVD